MLWNILIIALLVVITIFAFRRTGKQMKNPCAGCSGCTSMKMEEKKCSCKQKKFSMAEENVKSNFMERSK